MIFGRKPGGSAAVGIAAATTPARGLLLLLAVFASLLLVVAAGCGGGGGGDDDDGLGGGQQGPAPAVIFGRLVGDEVGTQRGIPGATITFGGVTGLTDADGNFRLEVPVSEDTNNPTQGGTLTVTLPLDPAGNRLYYVNGYVNGAPVNVNSGFPTPLPGSPDNILSPGEQVNVGTIRVFSTAGPPPPPPI